MADEQSDFERAGMRIARNNVYAGGTSSPTPVKTTNTLSPEGQRASLEAGGPGGITTTTWSDGSVTYGSGRGDTYDRKTGELQMNMENQPQQAQANPHLDQSGVVNQGPIDYNPNTYEKQKLLESTYDATASYLYGQGYGGLSDQQKELVKKTALESEAGYYRGALKKERMIRSGEIKSDPYLNYMTGGIFDQYMGYKTEKMAYDKELQTGQSVDPIIQSSSTVTVKPTEGKYDPVNSWNTYKTEHGIEDKPINDPNVTTLHYSTYNPFFGTPINAEKVVNRLSNDPNYTGGIPFGLSATMTVTKTPVDPVNEDYTIETPGGKVAQGMVSGILSKNTDYGGKWIEEGIAYTVQSGAKGYMYGTEATERVLFGYKGDVKLTAYERMEEVPKAIGSIGTSIGAFSFPAGIGQRAILGAGGYVGGVVLPMIGLGERGHEVEWAKAGMIIGGLPTTSSSNIVSGFVEFSAFGQQVHPEASAHEITVIGASGSVIKPVMAYGMDWIGKKAGPLITEKVTSPIKDMITKREAEGFSIRDMATQSPKFEKYYTQDSFQGYSLQEAGNIEVLSKTGKIMSKTPYESIGAYTEQGGLTLVKTDKMTALTGAKPSGDNIKIWEQVNTPNSMIQYQYTGSDIKLTQSYPGGMKPKMIDRAMTSQPMGVIEDVTMNLKLEKAVGISKTRQPLGDILKGVQDFTEYPSYMKAMKSEPVSIKTGTDRLVNFDKVSAYNEGAVIYTSGNVEKVMPGFKMDGIKAIDTKQVGINEWVYSSGFSKGQMGMAVQKMEYAPFKPESKIVDFTRFNQVEVTGGIGKSSIKSSLLATTKEGFVTTENAFFRGTSNRMITEAISKFRPMGIIKTETGLRNEIGIRNDMSFSGREAVINKPDTGFKPDTGLKTEYDFVPKYDQTYIYDPGITDVTTTRTEPPPEIRPPPAESKIGFFGGLPPIIPMGGGGSDYGYSGKPRSRKVSGRTKGLIYSTQTLKMPKDIGNIGKKGKIRWPKL